jgi:hypothetical protein
MNRRSTDGTLDATAVRHSADRLAKAIVVATHSSTDLRTLTAWGASIGVSRGALRVWCRTAGVQARATLDFLRILRAVIQSKDSPWNLLNALDVVDERSLDRLLIRGDLVQFRRSTRSPTLDEFMTRQRFLENPALLEAVSRRLRHHPH